MWLTLKHNGYWNSFFMQYYRWGQQVLQIKRELINIELQSLKHL